MWAQTFSTSATKKSMDLTTDISKKTTLERFKKQTEMKLLTFLRPDMKSLKMEFSRLSSKLQKKPSNLAIIVLSRVKIVNLSQSITMKLLEYLWPALRLPR